MAFKERTREYWHNVGDHKCQYEYWDESKDEWVECRKKSKHIHHIIPESTTLAQGGNPEENVGMPLCEEHHVRNLESEEHSDNSSFHPDIGYAYRDYSFWKGEKDRFGVKTAGPSPFQEVAREHRKMADKGKRTHSGTVEIDHYYKEKMRSKALIYNATTGEKKPRTKQHPKTDRSKRKNWYDEYFERGEPVDEKLLDAVIEEINLLLVVKGILEELV